jgi:cytochrome c553
MLSKRDLCSLALALALSFVSGCDTPMSGDRGELLFNNNCAPCHTPTGIGKHELAAPNIAGLPQWYVEAQIKKFQTGARGAHFDDIAGMRMRPMSKTLESPEDVTLTARYVSSLSRMKNASTLAGGDVARGKVLYNTCMACHGPEGAGNEAMNAPPIAGADDWYMHTQLNNFKVGIRGANAKDTTGATMRPMAMTLADDQAVLDVIAYVKTL